MAFNLLKLFSENNTVKVLKIMSHYQFLLIYLKSDGKKYKYGRSWY